MNDLILRIDPNEKNPLFDRLMRFRSEESYDWYIRGCPDGEWKVLYIGLATPSGAGMTNRAWITLGLNVDGVELRK